MAHVVLLGNSIFDNSAYVAGGPDNILAGSKVLCPPHDGVIIRRRWHNKTTLADQGQDLAKWEPLAGGDSVGWANPR